MSSLLSSFIWNILQTATTPGLRAQSTIAPKCLKLEHESCSILTFLDFCNWKKNVIIFYCYITTEYIQ